MLQSATDKSATGLRRARQSTEERLDLARSRAAMQPLLHRVVRDAIGVEIGFGFELAGCRRRLDPTVTVVLRRRRAEAPARERGLARPRSRPPCTFFRRPRSAGRDPGARSWQITVSAARGHATRHLRKHGLRFRALGVDDVLLDAEDGERREHPDD